MGKRLSSGEFTVLIALLFALIAAGSDTMLPALEIIGSDLGVINANDAQLVVTIFFLGTGLGQLIAGPLSDAWGRKIVLGGGIAIFIASSIWCAFTSDFTGLLIARFIQGVGISAPRSAGLALVRDIYAGRQMARVVSLAMMLFVLVPAVAPFLGQGIMLAFGWRAIFWIFVVLGLVAFSWLTFRQEETHLPQNRRPFRIKTIASAFREVFWNKRVVLSLLALSFVQAILFSFISTSQQMFVGWLGVGDRFPMYFAIASIAALFSNGLNARFVERLGMWLMSMMAIIGIIVVSVIMTIVIWLDFLSIQAMLPAFMVWVCCMFFMASFCFGNLNALAMEPMGHIAGTASAVIGAASTSVSIAISIGVGQLYNGTGLPLLICVSLLSIGALILNIFNPRNAEQT